jgi:hypothetical protein
MLEHDWYLNENFNKTYQRLRSSINLLDEGYSSIKLRNMKKPGFTDFVIYSYMDNPLDHYDISIGKTSPHLLDTCHFQNNIHELYPDKIGQIHNNDVMYYSTTSRFGNYTNQPTIYKTKFFLDIIERFENEFDNISKYDGLENLISKWWADQDYKVAHSEGLFTHLNVVKDVDYYELLNYYAQEKRIFG